MRKPIHVALIIIHEIQLLVKFCLVIISFFVNLVYNLAMTFLILICSLPVHPYLPLDYNTHLKNSFILEGKFVFDVYMKILGSVRN